jgi:hypothetical protein
MPVGVAALAALVVSAVAGYLGVHALSGGKGPDAPFTCGGTTCVAAVNDSTLIPPLQARGFTCSRTGSSVGEEVTCELQGGSADYQLLLDSLGTRGSDGLMDYDIQVTYDSTVALLPPVIGFASWAARLPLPHDPPGASAASSWVVGQVKSVGNAKTTVDGYQYRATGRQVNSRATMATETTEHVHVSPAVSS